jgi:hypothetical protein
MPPDPAPTTNSRAREVLAPVSLKAGGVRWRVRSAAVAESLAELFRDPERVFDRKESLLRHSDLVSLARVALPAAIKGSALLRRSNYGNPYTRWRDFFRRAGALRAFRNVVALEQAGQSIPRVFAAGVVRDFNLPRVGYLLIEEIAPATTLAQLAQEPGVIGPDVARRVAAEIARLHQSGFLHGDLTINNVLLDEGGQPWFIDLERARSVGRPLNWRQAVEDFHRFARHYGKFTPAGRRHALRLLRHYCADRGWAGREREFVEALFRRMKHKLAVDRLA